MGPRPAASQLHWRGLGGALESARPHPSERRATWTRNAGCTTPPRRPAPCRASNPEQIENLLLRTVLTDLKAAEWGPASTSNRSKCELGERSRRATGLPLRSITAFLRISKNSYKYHRRRLGLDKYAWLRPLVRETFEQRRANWSYRTTHAKLARAGVRASEKVVRRVMAEEGLGVVYNKKRRRGYSSYAGEVSEAPENLVKRNFHADAPDKLWLTNITEFKLPSGRKVYLSAVIDCFDGMPAAWSIGWHPSAELANSSLAKALAQRRPGARTVVRPDCGRHYRWPGWIGICKKNGLVRSVSAKGCSPDNAACEGFFGRIKRSLGRLSPIQTPQKAGFAA